METEPSSSTNNPATIMAKLKLAGAYAGILEVELDVWTIPMLREQVSKRANCELNSISLICGGKVLKDGEGKEKLCELGIKNNSKILVAKVCSDQGNVIKNEFLAEEERSRRLGRIKAAAVALAKRHAEGSLPIEDFNLEVEDQSGQKVHLGSETDQQGVMMGLMLHANGKHLIKKQMYKDALDVLSMGEEAFSLCDPKVLKMIDNVPILQIDTVWCYFMLRDITWLSMAGVRLAKAREGIERSHGKDLTRVRTLQGGCQPELALHLRLELLEGVVAYHSAQFDKCKKALTSAQAKYVQLQVPEELMLLLKSMGYKEKEAKRALKMNNHHVERAVEFLVEEKEKNERRMVDDIQRRKEIMEQKRYGMTPLRKAVDLQRLNELVSIGFEKGLAAEALRRNENDTGKALDDLTNPEINSMIQLDIDSRRRKRLRQETNAAIEELVAMGFERSKVAAAVRATGSHERALNLLTAGPGPNPTVAVHGSVSSADSEQNSQSSDTSSEAENTVSSDTPNNVDGMQGLSDGMEGPSGINRMEARDIEMENAIASELTGDAFADYDIEVTVEGEAITEYLALLASTGGN
ncbi:hypothetical protein IFM89_011969 [Coptis chinensis]|uniref:NEDD8 ultimate buster 1 n=1 Tax=Coptis chinensis TaxID=261450 RepID=A0A835I963_9MAGN|nr:hypothetical protein IFM89_011969 [Coptis chinensis]